jgi:hypothetical protein
MAKTSYAKAMELAASKRAKHEQRLETARRTGDRFAINSAQRAIDKLTDYENQLFESQEEQKVKKGITPPMQSQEMMGYGGIPKMNDGGIYNLSRKDSAPQGAQMMNPFINNPGASVDPNLPFSQTPGGQLLSQAKQYLPYAAQFGTDLYALNQLKKLEGPVDAPMQQVTQINTDVDTSATRARIQDNMAAFNAGVDSSMSNSAAVQNVKLANLAQTNRQFADIGQQEANQEMALRNQQATLATGTLNTNLGINAANQQRTVDFNNMMINARLGLVQGMGIKGAQMGQEFAQRNLDQQRLETLAKQYDSGLLARNFSDLGIGGNPYTDETTRTMMVNALKDPAMKDQMMQRLESNPDLLQYLMQFVNP